MRWVVLVGVLGVGAGLWLWLLRRYDKAEPEPVRHLLQVAILGGLASVAAAALLNEAMRRGLDVGPLFTGALEETPLALLLGFTLFVGFNEEVCKALATVYVTPAWGNLDEPVDAMIYAMTVGLGFAVIETAVYAVRFGNDVLLMRFLWPVPAHMAYAAVWGYGLARARFVFPHKRRLWIMAPAVLLAGFVHAATNFMLFVGGAVAAAVSLFALLGLAYVAHHRLRELAAESPFLRPGECPECLHQNAPGAAACTACDRPLRDTHIFTTCPCHRARVPVRSDMCPFCERVLPSGWAEAAEAPR